MSDKQNERLEVVKKLRDFAVKLQELSPEITKIIDDNFWELLAERNGASVEAYDGRIAEKEAKELADRDFKRVNMPNNTNEQSDEVGELAKLMNARCVGTDDEPDNIDFTHLAGELIKEGYTKHSKTDVNDAVSELRNEIDFLRTIRTSQAAMISTLHNEVLKLQCSKTERCELDVDKVAKWFAEYAPMLNPQTYANSLCSHFTAPNVNVELPSGLVVGRPSTEVKFPSKREHHPECKSIKHGITWCDCNAGEFNTCIDEMKKLNGEQKNEDKMPVMNYMIKNLPSGDEVWANGILIYKAQKKCLSVGEMAEILMNGSIDELHQQIYGERND